MRLEKIRVDVVPDNLSTTHITKSSDVVGVCRRRSSRLLDLSDPKGAVVPGLTSLPSLTEVPDHVMEGVVRRAGSLQVRKSLLHEASSCYTHRVGVKRRERDRFSNGNIQSKVMDVVELAPKVATTSQEEGSVASRSTDLGVEHLSEDRDPEDDTLVVPQEVGDEVFESIHPSLNHAVRARHVGADSRKSDPVRLADVLEILSISQRLGIVREDLTGHAIGGHPLVEQGAECLRVALGRGVHRDEAREHVDDDQHVVGGLTSERVGPSPVHSHSLEGRENLGRSTGLGLGTLGLASGVALMTRSHIELSVTLERGPPEVQSEMSERGTKRSMSCSHIVMSQTKGRRTHRLRDAEERLVIARVVLEGDVEDETIDLEIVLVREGDGLQEGIRILSSNDLGNVQQLRRRVERLGNRVTKGRDTVVCQCRHRIEHQLRRQRSLTLRSVGTRDGIRKEVLGARDVPHSVMEVLEKQSPSSETGAVLGSEVLETLMVAVHFNKGRLTVGPELVKSVVDGESFNLCNSESSNLSVVTMYELSGEG